jgi:hypothetical protein
MPPELQEWLGSVFPMEQRLRLRRPPEDPIVRGYHSVRERLLELQDHTLRTLGYESAVDAFEAERDRFLEVARDQLAEPVKSR